MLVDVFNIVKLVTPDQCKLIMPKAPEEWILEILSRMPAWDISTPERESAFIAQIAHESIELTHVEENLNYSVHALMGTWPRKFPTELDAQPYSHQPEKLANFVYGNRSDLGNTEPGDGWMFRGRSPIQLTGRGNYKSCGFSIGEDLEQFPEKACRPSTGSDIACWFWYSKCLNDLADSGDFEGITRKINGGLNGLEQRLSYYNKAKEVLGIS